MPVLHVLPCPKAQTVRPFPSLGAKSRKTNVWRDTSNKGPAGLAKVSRPGRGARAFQQAKEGVRRGLARQTLRAGAVSHLLAASQGALTAPLFGEAPASEAGGRAGRAARMQGDREAHAGTRRPPGTDRGVRVTKPLRGRGGETQTEGPRPTETERTRKEREMSNADGAPRESERVRGCGARQLGARRTHPRAAAPTRRPARQ